MCTLTVPFHIPVQRFETPRNKAPLCNQAENLITQCQSSHFYSLPQWPHCTRHPAGDHTHLPFPTLSSHREPTYRHAQHTVQYDVIKIWHQQIKDWYHEYSHMLKATICCMLVSHQELSLKFLQAGVHYHYTMQYSPSAKKFGFGCWTCKATLPVKEVNSGGKGSGFRE